MRIAVVGAKGQLGAAIVNECRTRYDAVTALDRSTLDVRDDRAVVCEPHELSVDAEAREVL